MHRAFREALDDTTGRSEFVIVVVADIRGFSRSSQERESPDTAMYIKRVYAKLIDVYFPGASFYKPTGDGLLVTIPYDEKNLSEIANRTVDACLSCLKNFESICADDPMINFPVPSSIGFGLARGTACCLVSGDKVLDYSGHLLNLASRLMNLARPAGVVLDGAFGIGLLRAETRELFSEAGVYLRSLAEESPTKVCFLKSHVQIPEEAKTPLSREAWETWTRTQRLSQWEKLMPIYRLNLPKRLKHSRAAQITLQHPAVRGGKRVRGVTSYRNFTDWEYITTGAQPWLSINVSKFIEELAKSGLPKGAMVTLSVNYIPVK